MNPSRNLRLTPLREASGGTCNAYTAHLSGKKVFIKEIKPEFAGDARMHAVFRKEAEIGFRLDHPNLPKYIFTEGILPSERYIVQEFIDGQTLPTFIKDNPTYFQNKKKVERFIQELTDVIDYLHRNQTVHLDLKPENILISRVGTSLKLIDLGFCASDYYDDTRGYTPGELAPEGYVNPGERGTQSDYYGIGKILTYIRGNTPGFPQKRFRKIEARLLLKEPTKRLSSKEEIEKALEKSSSRKQAGLIAFSAASLLMIMTAGIIYRSFSVDTEEKTPPSATSIISAKIQASDDVEESESRVLPNGDTPLAGHGAPAPTENYPAVSSDGAQAYSPQAYEKLKSEMEENININFADFDEMLKTFLRENKFKKEDYSILNDAYRDALHKTFDTSPYKARYNDLPPSVIDDIMAECVQEKEKKVWGPDYQKYIERYQEISEGLSR